MMASQMHRRLATCALLAGVLALLLSSCATSGVRYVIMTIDTQGKQPRSVFFTDSLNIVCVAMASAANPDTTLDFIVRQDTSTDPWLNNGSTDPVGLPSTDVFAATEVTVTPGSEEVEAVQIPATGIMASIQCYGYCIQNHVGGCDPAFINEGLDSCGPGATCCYQFGAQQATISNTSFPFPVGHFECDVSLNGAPVGTAPFDVVYPPNNCPTVPATTGQPCFGWVPPSSTCPGAGDLCCKCNGSQDVAETDPTYGTWVCTLLPPNATTCPP
jgi:hypothetical protein